MARGGQVEQGSAACWKFLRRQQPAWLVLCTCHISSVDNSTSCMHWPALSTSLLRLPHPQVLQRVRAGHHVQPGDHAPHHRRDDRQRLHRGDQQGQRAHAGAAAGARVVAAAPLGTPTVHHLEFAALLTFAPVPRSSCATPFCSHLLPTSAAPPTVSSYMILPGICTLNPCNQPRCHTGTATGCPALADRKKACRLCSRLSMSAISALASA